MGSMLYAGATHIIEQSKIDAARITQKSGNEKRGAIAALQRGAASIANQRVLDAAGSQVNDISGNIARNLDAASQGHFMSRIAAAEELGSSMAMAAAAGVGGSSVEAYNSTVRLNRAMQEEQAMRAVNSDNINMSAQRGAVMSNAVAGMDNNVYNADQDFTQYVDHKKGKGLFSFEGIATVAGAAAATYFGGPKAGQAVLKLGTSLIQGNNAAANGDFATAGSQMDSAIKAGFDTFKAAGDKIGQWQSNSKVAALSKKDDGWRVRLPSSGSNFKI